MDPAGESRERSAEEEAAREEPRKRNRVRWLQLGFVIVEATGRHVGCGNPLLAKPNANKGL
jgi:hypothetical protein